jgi:hypothetical protein
MFLKGFWMIKKKFEKRAGKGFLKSRKPVFSAKKLAQKPDM